MCGICGFLDGAPGAGDPALLANMTAALAHRGPDDDGFYTDSRVSLGHRRLSIIGLDTGHQPLGNEDGTIQIVYNGELYNYPELKPELAGRGHRFRTDTDTEALVHAYEEYGDAFLGRLNGIFAFALWDGRRRRLLLARDPFGVKPLYYQESGGRVRFASEIKALLEDPTVPRELDHGALESYLTFGFVPSPDTLLRGVHKVPPGHYVVCTEAGTAAPQPYTPPPPEPRTFRDEAEVVAALREALPAAVKRQMLSDVPVGALLSGGVDSAGVVALMRQATGAPISTFTVGFEDAGALDELAAARATAAYLGTTHHEVVVTRAEYEDLFAQAIWHLDEPVSSYSAVGLYCVARLAHQHVKVVLTGQGADEPFAGYPRYYGEQYAALYRRVPAPVRHGVIAPVVEALPRAARLKRAVRSLGREDTLDRFTAVYSLFDSSLQARLWQPGARTAHAEAGLQAKPFLPEHVPGRQALRGWLAGTEHLPVLDRMLYVDARFSLADNLLLYGDKMTMAHALEARVPYLDLEFMRLVEAIPATWKLRGRVGKYIHKRALAAWLPPEILHRRKLGFAEPVDLWFQGRLHGFVRDTLLGPDSICTQLFRPAVLTEMLADHAARRRDYTRQLFTLLAFAVWHRRYLGGAVAA